MKPRLALLLLLPTVAVAAWWFANRPEPKAVVRWVAHEQVFGALLEGELVRTTEVLDAGTLRGQVQTVEVDPRDFSAAEGMLSNPQGSPPYAWCIGLHSGFDLDVLEPQDRRLHIELANGTSTPQHVSVAFNGKTRVEQDLPVGAGPATILTADIPAADQVHGSNRVDLTFTQTETRSLIGQPVALPIAAVLTHTHFLRTDRVERLPGPPPPLGLQTVTDTTGSRAVLVLPPGTSARAPLRLPAAERLALRLQLERLGVPLELWLSGDSGLRTRLVRVEPEGFTPRELQVDLSDWSGQTVVLDFWAQEGSAEAAQISGAVLLVPETWRPGAIQTPEGAGAPSLPSPENTAATENGGAPAPAPSSRPSFLLVTLDAFARRQLGVVAPGAEVVPRLTDLGTRGAVFRDATSMASYTLSSVATLLTGQSPLHHGVNLVSTPSAGGASTTSVLREDAPRLARTLREQGWRTAAFVTNPNAAARHGFGEGFERYDELFRDESLWEEGVAGTNLPPRLAEWLGEVGSQPFFAWVHVFEPHAPYVSPPDLLARWVEPYDGPVRGDREWIDAYRFGEVQVDAAGWRHLRELYAARMALADRTLGALLDTLAAAGRAQDTIVIVTGDHGESLGDHGDIEHGDTVYSDQVDVPLVFCVPGRAPAAQSGPASVADIAPTVLALAGLPAPAGMDGLDLLAAAPDSSRPLFARSSERLPKLSWTRDSMRLIVDLATRRRELYDLVRDPGETSNLLRQRPATAAMLYRELCEAVCEAQAQDAARADAQPASDPAQDPATLLDDPLLREQARAIGYVGGSSAAQPATGDRANDQCELLRTLLRRT